jgi:hypothetical protein
MVGTVQPGEGDPLKEKIALLLAGLVAGSLIVSFIPAQAHHGSDFRALNRKVRTLQAKTQALETDGLYYGPVFGWQVVSQCVDGSTAVWEQIPVAGLEDFRYLYDCPPEETARKQLRRQLRGLLDALK